MSKRIAGSGRPKPGVASTRLGFADRRMALPDPGPYKYRCEAAKMRAADMRNTGFTLIEVILVVAVLLALFAIGFPTLSHLMRRGDIASTSGLVGSVASTIAAYPQQMTISYDHDDDDADDDGRKDSDPLVAATPRKQRVLQAWDVNASADGAEDAPGDEFIDGRPALVADATHDGPYWHAVLDHPYSGFIAMTHFPASRRFQVNERGQLIDRWRQPLRLIYSGEHYGASGFCVTSAGPDRLFDTEDDIASN
jgi:prepilin-type N-terminal cleavage/methylation domain-containing protein